jgi:hypothetical protein
VWALFGADLLAVLVVYSLVEPERLRNVSHEGIAGGLGRALVQLDYPVAIVAILVVLLALAALPRGAWWVGGPAIALCAVVAWPGVVDQGDFDARPVNAVPALGVVVALGLTIAAARRSGSAFAPWRPTDRVRVALGVVAVLVATPWIAAELGFHFPPWVFLTDQPYQEPGHPVTAAVHLGHHHGFSGTLFLLAARLLSRPSIPSVRLRVAYGALVSLLLVYGSVNLVQDFWHEQIVKRGWTGWDVPEAIVPRLHAIWLFMLAGAAIAYALGFARGDTAAANGDNPAR